MEDKRIDGMESLRLITEMINRTKREEPMKQDYNQFLLYGYTAVIIALCAWVLIKFTGHDEFMFLWFAMFLPYLWTSFSGKKGSGKVVTYLDSMLTSIWQVVSCMFIFTLVAIVLAGVVSGMNEIDLSLMMPLSLIYAGMGTSMTGVVLKEEWFIWPPLVGLVAAACMLVDDDCDNSWNLLFGAGFLIFMVIPAHIARNKVGK